MGCSKFDAVVCLECPDDPHLPIYRGVQEAIDALQVKGAGVHSQIIIHAGAYEVGGPLNVPETGPSIRFTNAGYRDDGHSMKSVRRRVEDPSP